MTLGKFHISWLNLLSIVMILVAAGLFVSGAMPASEMLTSNALGAGPGGGGGVTGDDDDDSTADSEEEVYCILQLAPELLEAESETISYLSQLFNMEDDNSTLVAEALNSETGNGVFDFEDKAQELLDEYAVIHKNEDAESEFKKIEACEFFVDQHMRTVKALLQDHNLRTSSGKTTYTLVMKLRELNEGLRELNISFSKMYAGFKDVSDKLTNTTE